VLKKIILGSVVAAAAVMGLAMGPATASAAPGHPANVVATVAKPHQSFGPCTFTNSQPQLQRGSQGTAVKQAQCELNWAFAFGSTKNYGNGAGNGLSEDGDFGTNTFNAAEDFQRCAGIGIDGKIGPQTWNKLNFWVHQPTFC
jgi:zinc D-Ala-D-Ala carboxypeptidase